MPKAIEAKIVLDSLNTATGDRITTFVVTVPKWLLAEVRTHRALSMNAASSRAIPAKRVRCQVLADPFVPVSWGANRKGMQASVPVSPNKQKIARWSWLTARFPAMAIHWVLSELLGLHKQLCNRLLEPWMWADVVLTATEWKNFFILRCSQDAQPEFQMVATQMLELREKSIPIPLAPGEWHLPFMPSDHEAHEKLEVLKQISAARCARVSYLLPESERLSTPERDLELCQRLILSGHLSPFEHVAVALPARDRCANFVGFGQWRHEFPNEANGDYSIAVAVSAPSC